MNKEIEITKTLGPFGEYIHQEGDKCTHCGDTVIPGHFGYNGYCSDDIESHVTIKHERMKDKDIPDLDSLFTMSQSEFDYIVMQIEQKHDLYGYGEYFCVEDFNTSDDRVLRAEILCALQEQKKVMGPNYF